LEPVRQGRGEQVPGEQSLRRGPIALAPVLGEQQDADLQAAALRPGGLDGARADDPGQGPVGQDDGELVDVTAKPAVLLPARRRTWGLPLADGR
jgi:hypothetical protein